TRAGGGLEAGTPSGVWGGAPAGVWGRSPEQHSCGEAAPVFGAEPQPPRPPGPPPGYGPVCAEP
ncbi:MAG: energy transducer TonB, partial [Gammaproteobacteria bacterium]|nr:energy transducer TonB [Gammaproteobacteria bacterium]